LTTTGATTSPPTSVPLNLHWVAIDPETMRAYWAGSCDTTQEISYARLSGAGGADVDTTGATVDQPSDVALLAPPSRRRPGDHGRRDGRLGAVVLTGQLGGDSPAAFYWRSPTTFAYEWTSNGTMVPGGARRS